MIVVVSVVGAGHNGVISRARGDLVRPFTAIHAVGVFGTN